MRSDPTSAEFRLWPYLRDRKLGGLKFTRQTPIGPWFVYLVRRSHNVIVEIDGATHGTPEELAKDAQRTRDLEARGYRIFRVSNNDIYHNVDGVLEGLLGFIRQGND